MGFDPCPGVALSLATRGQSRLATGPSALKVTRPESLTNGFLLAALEVPESLQAGHDRVVLTEPNAKGCARRKRSSFLDARAVTVNLNQISTG